MCCLRRRSSNFPPAALFRKKDNFKQEGRSSTGCSTEVSALVWQEEHACQSLQVCPTAEETRVLGEGFEVLPEALQKL